jgi:thioredoxin-like negative regulator of GroEL
MRPAVAGHRVPGRRVERFEAWGLPTYLVFKDGQPVDRLYFSQIGWLLEARIRRMLNGALD